MAEKQHDNTEEPKNFLDKPVEELTDEDLELIRKQLAEEDPDFDVFLTRDDVRHLKEAARAVSYWALANITDGIEKGAEIAINAVVDYLKAHMGEDGERVRAMMELSLSDEAFAEIRKRVRQEIETGVIRKAHIRPDKLDFPLDKINSNLWYQLEHEDNGQYSFNLAGPPSALKQELALVSINFDALTEDESLAQIEKKLTPFDKRVYTAIAALYSAGNKQANLRDIHIAMGGKTEPSQGQETKIYNSVVKMMKTVITLDDPGAADRTGFDKYNKTRNLLYAAFDTGIVYQNGIHSNFEMRILAEPTLISYARAKRQITTIPLRLLQGPYNKTDAFIAIEDYIIEQIAHKKHSNAKRFRMLYETICKRVRQTERKQRERVPEKVNRILKYYQSCEYLTKYEMGEDGVTITL